MPSPVLERLESPTRGLTRPPCVTWRDRLETELVPGDSTVPEHKRFIPSSIIHSIFGHGDIQEILGCWCSKCETCRRLSGNLEAFIDPKLIIGSPDPNSESPPSLVLFALLVYIEFPSLVHLFLRRGIGDRQLNESTSSFDTIAIRSIIGNEAYLMFPRFAERFHWSKYQFLVPQIEDLIRAANYAVFPKEAILPFVNEAVVGQPDGRGNIISEGSFGTVYKFELFDGYGEFPEFPGVRQFARKELHANTAEERFNAEGRNLLAVKKIGDDHLVKIVTAYKHGNAFNLIFPLAQTNLHRYLREPWYRPFGDSRSIAQHPIWPQLLGIAHGLHKVQHFHEDTSSNEACRYGYHFDLKPANILVDDSGCLIITDFGQAVFKKATDSTNSKVVGMGGTETYAPPESDHIGTGLDRRYDIWSLGCIFLEALVFVVSGYEGLLQLDRSRIFRDPETGNIDDRFYAYDKRNHSHTLKSQLLDQIQLLPGNLREATDTEFVQKFLDLVLRMMDVNPRTRLTSTQAWTYLSKIIHDPGDIQAIDVIRDIQYPSEGGLNLEEFRSDPWTMSLRINGLLQGRSVELVSDGMQLRAQISRASNTTEVFIGYCRTLRMVPQYALHNPGSYYFLDSSLSIVHDDPTEADENEYTLDCRQNLSAAYYLQEKLLSQKIVESWRVRSIKLSVRPKKPGPIGFRRRSSASSSGLDLDSLGQASAIQLWNYEEQKDATTPSPRSHFRLVPPHRRIIIFFSETIVLLRIAKNFRIKKLSQSKEGHASMIEFVPTSDTDRSFSASILRKRSDMPAPSFALSGEAFEAEEMNGKVECSSLTITFHTPHDASLFSESYMELKRQWREDVKRYDALLCRTSSKTWDVKL